MCGICLRFYFYQIIYQKLNKMWDFLDCTSRMVEELDLIQERMFWMYDIIWNLVFSIINWNYFNFYLIVLLMCQIWLNVEGLMRSLLLLITLFCCFSYVSTESSCNKLRRLQHKSTLIYDLLLFERCLFLAFIWFASFFIFYDFLYKDLKAIHIKQIFTF